MEKELSDACVAQWLEQSTGNRKTWARIPAQSKASFFHRKISNSLNLNINKTMVMRVKGRGREGYQIGKYKDRSIKFKCLGFTMQANVELGRL